MERIEQGAIIELREGSNQYQVLKADVKFALLKCITFVCAENLGDEIVCLENGEEIWIAQFHAWLYEESTQRKPEISSTR